MKQLTYETVVAEVLRVAPELHPEYQRCLADELLGMYTDTLLSEVVFPYIIRILRNSEGNAGVLRRLFDFLEMMAGSEDREMRRPLKTAGLRRLLEEPQACKAARSFMGPATKRLLQDAIDYFSIPERMCQRLPELRAPYEEERASWGSELPGLTNIFVQVLVPHIFEWVSIPEYSDVLKRAWAFVEGLAAGEDPIVVDEVALSVVDCFRATPELDVVRPLMGPKTLRMLQELEEWQPKDEVATRAKAKDR